MDEFTMNAIQLLTSYGGLGVVAIYFMWKDATVTKELKNALNDFTVAMETFLKVRGNADE